MNSDHSPIILTISKYIIRKETTPTLVNNATDWENFKQKLEEKMNLSVPLRNEQELNEKVEIFANNIQQSALKPTPVAKRRTERNNYQKSIRDLIGEKRKLRRKWQQFGSPQNTTNLNNAIQQLKSEIQHNRNESINTYLQSLTSDSTIDSLLWKTTKVLKRPIIHIP